MSFIVSCAVISNHNNGVGKLLVIYPLLKHFRVSRSIDGQYQRDLNLTQLRYILTTEN